MEGVVLKLARQRKSIRHYMDRNFSISKILYAIKAAMQAPSGANQQPWYFIIIDDPEIKANIKTACEKGEKKFYENVRGELRDWLMERKMSWRKPFLTEAPYIIAVFSELGKPYTVQSTWLAIGYLLLALEEVGLASLTYTPPNPKEVAKILGASSKFILQTLIPVGFPRTDKLKEPRKKLHETTFYNQWGTPLSSMEKSE